MAHLSYKQLLSVGTLALAATVVTTGCVDSSYDFSEDIDLTMGLGSDGLTFPMGDVEQIFLGDILEIDENNVELDATNMYYLVEEGSTTFKVKVNNVNASFNNPTVRNSNPALTFDQVVSQSGRPASTTSVSISRNQTFDATADGKNYISMNVTDVDPAIVWVDNVDLAEQNIYLKLQPSSSASANDLSRYFKVTTIKRGSKVHFPELIVISQLADPGKWEITADATGTMLKAKRDITVPANGILTSFKINRANLKKAPVPDGNKATKRFEFTDAETEVTFAGSAIMTCTSSCTMNRGQSADFELSIKVGSPNAGAKTPVTATKATGRFNPEINVDNPDPIAIGNDLPDFLQDDEVRVGVSNPTIRFNVDMTEVPADVQMSATLQGIKNDQSLKTVVIPGQTVGTPRNYTLINKETSNWVYFYQSGSPYDPAPEADGVVNPISVQVDNISDLVEKIPETIEVNLQPIAGTPQLCVPVDRNYTVELDRNYTSSVDYKVFVPFMFNGNVTIVYTDESNDMNKDVKDYAAEGLHVTADAENTIPLDLELTLIPYDTEGQEIRGIHFSTAQIPAGTYSDSGSTPTQAALTIEGTLDNPQLLSKLDKIEYKVKAASGQDTSSKKLMSTQYVQLKNLRLKLKGQVIGDFND